MLTTFKDEADFEATLVKTLSEKKGWADGILRYPSEEDLVRNWADILFANNDDQDHLNGCPLTDTEMRQILEQVNSKPTTADVNRLINGRYVIIKRDNPMDALHYGAEVALRIYSRDEIAGGHSRYQIAVQPRFKAKKSVFPQRRGDVVLLINGMPVIHIELKRSGVDVSHAVVQIEKYSREGVFATGIMKLVQVFVAMNPDEALYFANPGIEKLSHDGHFNRKFMFHWADETNTRQNRWDYIAEHLLSIPMAHKMVGFYTVADIGDSEGALKVMRSYQYYAASAIFDVVKNTEWGGRRPVGGYVWHTTGSGKTVTSFKAAQLIASAHKVDKVVFLVDRVELGDQSLLEYRNFANDDEQVNSTDNTHALFALLTSDNRNETLIVTSIQKLSNADRDKDYVTPAQVAKISSKKVVIVVDECHRSTFGDMMATIKDTFPYALRFGFTGTPIYDENRKKLSTTMDVFGPELHRYVLADGIADENVLGFDRTEVHVYDDYDLRRKVALEKARAEGATDEDREQDAVSDPKKRRVYLKYMNDVPMGDVYGDEYDADGNLVRAKVTHGIEHFLPRSQWEREEYREAVVDDVVKKWHTTSVGGMFHALFATSSITEATLYWRLFRKKAPSLNVTALFDPNIDGNEGYAYKEDALVEILEDYERMFGRTYTLSRHAGFKEDVSKRLAHKGEYRHIDKKPEACIDILIVVDQMLTGFDSKWLNTLYLDKVLEFEHIIQAFSRTNRVLRSEKRFGVIRYYRKPHTMRANIDRAVRLYSGEKKADLFVPKLGTHLTDANLVYAQIVNLFDLCGIANFERLPDGEADCEQFAKLFKTMSDKVEAARIQGFDWAIKTYGEEFGLEEPVTVAFDEETYLTLAQRYKELFGPASPLGTDVPFEIDTHLTSIDTGRIDAKYMQDKFDKWLKCLDQRGVSAAETQAVLDELHVSFARLPREDQDLAQVIIHDIQGGDLQLTPGLAFVDYLNMYRSRTEEGHVEAMVAAFGVDASMLKDLMTSVTTGSDPNSHGRLDQLRATLDVKAAGAFFESVTGETWKPRVVRMRATRLLTDFIVSGAFDLADEVTKRNENGWR